MEINLQNERDQLKIDFVFQSKYIQQILQQYQFNSSLCMAHCTDLFPSAFFLQSSNNGFFLHKIKRVTISSNFKFKSKIFNQTKVIDKTTQMSKQAIHNYKQDDNRQSASYSNRFKSLNLDSAQKMLKQKEQQSSRYDSRLNSAIIKPKFPEIRTYNTNSLAKSIANQPKASDKEDQNSLRKTVEPLKEKASDYEIDLLIQREILKTQNQTILKQGYIKFDESKIKVNKTHQMKKVSHVVKKRRKKSEQHNNLTSLELQKRKNCAPIQNPQIQKFNPLKIRYMEAAIPQDKRVSNKMLKVRNKEKKIQKLLEKVTAHGVRGWDNDSISNQSQALGYVSNEKDREIQFIRFWEEKDLS